MKTNITVWTTLALAVTALSSSVALAAAAPQTANDEVARAIARHRTETAAQASATNPYWSKPAKVLLLEVAAGRWGNEGARLRAALPGVKVVSAKTMAEAATEAKDADVIVGFNPEICDPSIINQAQKLRWLASLAAGVEGCMELPQVKAKKLMMTNMRGVDSPAIAEHAIAMLLALAHGLDRFALDTSKGVWNRGSQVPMQMLEGKTMLVAGLGGIGTEVAQRAASLGMKVIATRQGGSGKPNFVDYIGTPDELLALAARADVVVCALPLTPQTTNLFDAKFFAQLKPNAFFINIARGASVVTADLQAALESGRLAGAGLDVTEPEPLPADHPLWKAPRVLITPHISSRSDLPGEARWILAAENLRRYAAGEALLNEVNLALGY